MTIIKEKRNKEGFTADQIEEIAIGQHEGLPVQIYAKPEFLAIQMYQIRLGLEEELPVEKYAFPEYDWFQMEEIRKGLKEDLPVEKYASPMIHYNTMRQIRLGLKHVINLAPYAKLKPEILRELRKALESHVNIVEYIQKGYNEEQLEQIRITLERGLDIKPYLNEAYLGASIREIRKGIESGIDVSIYANEEYSWQQMREIRLGLVGQLDVSYYAKPLYDWQQMREIRLGLEEGIAVESYASLMYTAKEMCKRREQILRQQTLLKEHLQEQLAAPEQSTKPEQPQQVNLEEAEEEKIHVSVSMDAMEACIGFTGNKRAWSREEIVSILALNGVCEGILEDVVTSIVKDRPENMFTVIAKGRELQQGKDGWYEYLFNTNIEHTPKEKPDGSVDYQDINCFELVRKGQKIAYYHPAEEGVEGYTVTGIHLEAKKGKEAKLLIGTGFTALADKRTYMSTVDGKIELKGGRIDISNMLQLDEVNQATGNINFDGTVYVRGNVGFGVIIRATGDIVVDGYVEGSELYAGGSLILKKGCNAAGHGILHAQKSVIGKFFEAVQVWSKEEIQADYCLNSELYTEGYVRDSGKNGSIAGGRTYGARGSIAYNIGNAKGIPTDVASGKREEFREREREVKNKIEETNRTLVILRNAYQDFQNKYAVEVRNMNPTYLKIEDAIYTKELEAEKLRQKNEALKEEGAQYEQSKIAVRGSLYEGTVVRISGAKAAMETVRSVTLRKSGSKIAVYRN